MNRTARVGLQSTQQKERPAAMADRSLYCCVPLELGDRRNLDRRVRQVVAVDHQATSDGRRVAEERQPGDTATVVGAERGAEREGSAVLGGDDGAVSAIDTVEVPA